MDEYEHEMEDMTLEQIDKLEKRHKICAYCDKEFYLPYMVDLANYAYKLSNPMVNGKRPWKKHGRQLWFCSWSCLSKFRNSYAPKHYKESAKGLSLTDRIRNNED